MKSPLARLCSVTLSAGAAAPVPPVAQRGLAYPLTFHDFSTAHVIHDARQRIDAFSTKHVRAGAPVTI